MEQVILEIIAAIGIISLIVSFFVWRSVIKKLNSGQLEFKGTQREVKFLDKKQKERYASSENETFPILMLISRPAAGKSEIIDYLRNISIDERKKRFHIGKFEELDDFPIIWTWIEEDMLLEAMGKSRNFTDKDNYIRRNYYWDLLIKRLNLEYKKKLVDVPDYHNSHTMIFEFSRSSYQGGFLRAFENFDQGVIERSAVIYVDVSWEEALRKNHARYNPDDLNQLEYGYSEKYMERIKETDWDQITSVASDYLKIHGINMPYVEFHNEDDVTSARGDELGVRLEETLKELWNLYHTD